LRKHGSRKIQFASGVADFQSASVSAKFSLHLE